MATGAFFCLKQGGGADRLLGGHMKLDFHNRFILGRQASTKFLSDIHIFTWQLFFAKKASILMKGVDAVLLKKSPL